VRPEHRYDSLIQFFAARFGLHWQRIKLLIEA